MMTQLPSIVAIVPYTVKSSRQRSDRIKKSVAHPDSKDGIFLTEDLARSNPLTITCSNSSAHKKLQYTSEKRAGKYLHNHHY